MFLPPAPCPLPPADPGLSEAFGRAWSAPTPRDRMQQPRN